MMSARFPALALDGAGEIDAGKSPVVNLCLSAALSDKTIEFSKLGLGQCTLDFRQSVIVAQLLHLKIPGIDLPFLEGLLLQLKTT